MGRAGPPRSGPLRSGNPRGNPNLAPRCGAKARTTGLACRAPAMANGRCRLHGGKSTGPRTAEGLARLAAANTTHGRHAQAGHGAKLRLASKHARVAVRRTWLKIAACKHLPWLPPAFAARLLGDAPMELDAPMHYASWFPEWRVAEGAGAGAPGQAAGTARRDARGRFAAAPPPPLRGQAAERARGREEAATLAPWRTAIKRARLAKRGALAARRAARFEKFDKDPMEHPPGGVRGGQAVGGDGIAAVGGVGAAPAGVRAPVHPSRAVKVEISTKTQGGGGPGDSRAVAAGDGAAWGGRGIGIGEIVQGPCGVGTGAGDGGGGAAAGGGMGDRVDAPRPLVTWCGGGGGGPRGVIAAGPAGTALERREQERRQFGAVWPLGGGLRARLLGSSDLDGTATAVMVRGGMPALIEAIAAGGNVWKAIGRLCDGGRG